MYVHPKDVVPVMERLDVVYCIPCGGCRTTYIGETKRRLCKRIDEHKRAVHFEVSILAKHVWCSGHGVDWKKVSVLDHHHELYERFTLEAYHIRKQPLALNRDRGTLPVINDRLLRNF